MNPIPQPQSPPSSMSTAAAYDALPIPVVVAWQGGKRTLNGAARRLFGGDGARALDPQVEEHLGRALRGELVTSARIVVRCSELDPRERTWLLDATPVRGDGETTGAVCVIHDITDRALDEEMGDELLGTAAHDLRTPLTALKACVQLIERGLDRLDEKARTRTLSLLVAQVDKLSHKVDDVLDAARIRRGRVDVATVDVDVTHELGAILDETRRAPSALACDGHIEPGLHAHTDPARLRQVIRGILLDAGDRSVKEPAVVRASTSTHGVEIVIETKLARDSSRGRTMRRLARRLVEQLGGRAVDTLDETGSIRLTLPHARGAPRAG